MTDARADPHAKHEDDATPQHLPPYEPHDEYITYIEAGPRRDPSERRTFWHELWRKLGVLFGR